MQKCMFLLFVQLAYFSSDFDGVFFNEKKNGWHCYVTITVLT